MRMREWSIFVVAAALTFLPASSPAVTFQRQVGEITVGTAPGGADDLVARLVARHLGRFLPGNPTFVVSNIPGATGIIQANNLAAAMPKDGFVIGYINRQVVMQQFAGRTGIRFDATRFKWLGGLGHESFLVFVRRTLGITSVAQAINARAPLVFAARAAGGTDFIAGKALEALGVPLRLVLGYGAEETTIAFERGEFDASALGETAFKLRSAWSRPDGLARPILSFGAGFEEADFAPDLAPSPSHAALYRLIDRALSLPLATFAGPPNMADDVAASLADGFARMARDPDFLTDAAKNRVSINFLPAADVTRIFDRFLAATSAERSEFASMIR